MLAEGCLQPEVGAGCVVTAWSPDGHCGLQGGQPVTGSEAPSHGRLVQISLLKKNLPCGPGAERLGDAYEKSQVFEGLTSNRFLLSRKKTHLLDLKMGASREAPLQT